MFLSVRRDRIERVFRDYMASPELPLQLARLEARWLSSQPLQIDYHPRIAELDQQRANLVAAIKSGGLAAELGADLKALTAELERLKALSLAVVGAPRRAQVESLKTRVARMLKRLEEGGEVAQGVVRELFPDGIWLYPDPDGGRFLWAHAQTALPTDRLTHIDANGHLPAEHWPRVYNVIPEEPRNAVKVDGSGSGGRLQLFPQEESAAASGIEWRRGADLRLIFSPVGRSSLSIYRTQYGGTPIEAGCVRGPTPIAGRLSDRP